MPAQTVVKKPVTKDEAWHVPSDAGFTDMIDIFQWVKNSIGEYTPSTDLDGAAMSPDSGRIAIRAEGMVRVVEPGSWIVKTISEDGTVCMKTFSESEFNEIYETVSA